MVYKKKYAETEKPLLVISVIFAIVWIVAACLTARHGIQVTPFYFSTSPDFIFLLAANIGAVIMPFMLFYQVSATAEKGTEKKNIWAVRFETLIGAVVSEVIMVAIAISAIGISANSLDFTSPKVLSQSLSINSREFCSVCLRYWSYNSIIHCSHSYFPWKLLGRDRRHWDGVEKHWFKVYLIESIPAVVDSAFFV